jgi:NAD(P)-dependent dehydrogenase (short-subunit alcohol dehydrogenase family)
VEEVLERHERIDVAVNNAGIMPAGPLELTSDELAREVFDTNVLGPLRVARAVLPHMRAQASGRIVNVSSPADPRHGLRMVGLYVASKAALNALSMELAKEVRGFGIEVVVLQTGMGGATKMLTGLADQLADWAADTSAYADVKKIGAAQLAAMVEGSTDTAPSARLVADAVTVESPGLRFPADQAFADSWRDITDDEFVRLCDGADPAPIHRHHDIRWSFWLTGR